MYIRHIGIGVDLQCEPGNGKTTLKLTYIVLALGDISWPSLCYAITLDFIVPDIKDINKKSGCLFKQPYHFLHRGRFYGV